MAQPSSKCASNVFVIEQTKLAKTERRMTKTERRMTAVVCVIACLCIFEMVVWHNKLGSIISTSTSTPDTVAISNNSREEGMTAKARAISINLSRSLPATKDGEYGERIEDESEAQQNEGVVTERNEKNQDAVGGTQDNHKKDKHWSDEHTNVLKNVKEDENTLLSTKPFAVVHVGPHKTGSTTLQNFMYTNAAELALKEDNYRCPLLPMIDGKAKNIATLIHCFFPEGKNGKYAENNGCHQEEAILEYFSSFVNEAAVDGANILMSSEALDYIFNITSFTDYLVPHFKVHIVIYYRRFYDWLYSFYNQLAKQGGRGGTKGSNGQGIISFVEWLSLQQLDRLKDYHTAPVYERYSNVPDIYNISVVNMHDVSTFSNLPTFFCGHVDGAVNTCETAKKEIVGYDNPSQNLDWLVLQSKIPFYHPIELPSSPSFTQKHNEVWQKIESKFLSMNNVPKICLPADIEKRLLETSIQYEAAVTSKSWQNSEQGLDSLKADFKEKKNSRLCSIDTERVLKSAEWQDLFTQLSRL